MDHFLNKDLKISTLEKISRYEIINFLQKKNDNIGIELGVAKGDFSKKLIENNTFKFFFGVDSYSDFEEDLYGPDSHNEEQYKFALKNIGIRSNYNLLRMDFDNPVLKKWCDTEGYEGSELRKYLTENHSVSFTQVKYGEYTMKRKD